jgi:hypothetical protein
MACSERVLLSTQRQTMPPSLSLSWFCSPLPQAYQLNPAKGFNGQAVTDNMLVVSEKHRKEIVIILAGYKKDLEKLVAYNVGFPSRFAQVFRFHDYNEAQLRQILTEMLAKEQFTVQNPKHVRILCRRLAALAGQVGFGNARAVRQAFELALKRQAVRLSLLPSVSDAQLRTLERDDLLGPTSLSPDSAAMRKLRSMTGLASVKAAVQELVTVYESNVRKEENEEPLVALNLNRMFLGNPGSIIDAPQMRTPHVFAAFSHLLFISFARCCCFFFVLGTGKTVVAKLFAQILCDLGMLSKGEVVMKTASDFVGSVLGESEKNTNAILEASKGCCLIIDEVSQCRCSALPGTAFLCLSCSCRPVCGFLQAYSLHEKLNGGYKAAVIDTLVEKIQPSGNADRAVILLGYKAEMDTMMRETHNPGLKSRFNPESAFHFDDYTNLELYEILRQKVRAEMGVECSSDAARHAIKLLDVERSLPRFGNARAVDNLFSRMQLQREKRLRQGGAVSGTPLLPADFDAPNAKPPLDLDHCLDDLQGCENIKEMISSWRATFRSCAASGKNPKAKMTFNYRFVGSPGTGKTTIARKMGAIFYSLGLLATDEVVQVSAGDFTTGFADQAQKTTRALMEKGLGKVLFIDEVRMIAHARGRSLFAVLCAERSVLVFFPSGLST